MTTASFETAAAAAVRALDPALPSTLTKRVAFELEMVGSTLEAGDLADLFRSVDDKSRFLNDLGTLVHRWDAAEGADWSGDTEPRSTERRKLITDKLGLDSAETAALDARRPIFRRGPTVISQPWEPWYSPQRAAERDFYWSHYRRYLTEVKGWSHENVGSLDDATSKVVERLTDPTRPEAYQSKGLVVGYVQSGKTANFTGVTAKAIDAGYRLVIVMTGTLELLRAQTQRRIDMELIGRQNIVGDLNEAKRDDYLEDSDWEKFLDLGSDELETEIVRLTTHAADYKKQFKNLKINRPSQGKPLFDPDNLYRTSARIAIVKKNATVLRKLVKDIEANKNAFAEIPVLIIDDESDQASVNTIDPAKVKAAKADGRDVQERKAINEQIALMLDHMPRAQYVGYTATPFANVFVDPEDAQGIFPRDFLIGLGRPNGYMGVEDFYDFESNPGMSNEDAFVRSLRAEDDDVNAQDAELADALDAFVLSGAVKLWRARDGDRRFRHHTMLVHESVKKTEHAELAERVRARWKAGAFSQAAGRKRLQRVYEADTVPVSRERVEEGVEVAPDWDDLAPFVAKAIAKITEHAGDPVIVVNSDKDIQANQQALDFDGNDVWRVLVGGTKLSRGFTVEGLTVTYFRRATLMSDSLTQMGRWFGFRHGYRDLVRLYIARSSRFGKETVDLYEAFEGIAQNESAFRKRLEAYAGFENGKPMLTPAQIPPLVEQYLPWLKPTASNKMFNAVLVREVRQPFTPSGLGQGSNKSKTNLDLWLPLLSRADTRVRLQNHDGNGTFEALVGVVDASAFVDTISQLEYEGLELEASVRPVLTFYADLLDASSLTSFLLVLPQAGSELSDVPGLGSRKAVKRKRRRGTLFGEITEPRHRGAVQRFVEGEAEEALAKFHGPDVGACLVYFIAEAEQPGPVVVGFSSYVPKSALDSGNTAPTFTVRKPDSDDATVEVGD